MRNLTSRKDKIMKFLITLCNLYLAYADKMIVIDQVDKGFWIIKFGEFIPDSENSYIKQIP